MQGPNKTTDSRAQQQTYILYSYITTDWIGIAFMFMYFGWDVIYSTVDEWKNTICRRTVSLNNLIRVKTMYIICCGLHCHLIFDLNPYEPLWDIYSKGEMLDNTLDRSKLIQIIWAPCTFTVKHTFNCIVNIIDLLSAPQETLYHEIFTVLLYCNVMLSWF